MRIIFAAGGTGGHINPAIAAAREIQARYPDAAILFVGTKEKMESRLVPQAGFDFKTIEISGFQRKLTIKNIGRNIATLFRLGRASSQSKKLIRDFAPDVVVGFGGYVSGPVVREAAKMGIRTAIHEQNAYPGVTNKALAKTADTVMLTYAKAGEYMHPRSEPVITGLPVRPEIPAASREAARAAFSASGRSVILSFGGSLGAKAVNTVMTEIIPGFAGDNCLFIHAYGKYGGWVPDAIRQAGIDPDNSGFIRLSEYIDDMADCLAAADIVICRAGASTLSELAAAGRPSILIPSPNVAENHQFHNAMSLVSAGAAEIIEEKDLTPELLSGRIRELIGDPDRLKKMGEKARSLYVSDAAARIADRIVALAGSKEA